MIAGSYTPICVLSLDQKNGLPMLAVAWGLGLAGVWHLYCILSNCALSAVRRVSGVRRVTN